MHIGKKKMKNVTYPNPRQNIIKPFNGAFKDLV